MCWTGRIEDKKIASHDVKCRKIIKMDMITGKYVPFYLDHTMVYRMGGTYALTIQPRFSSLGVAVTLSVGNMAIERAFHAYSMKVKIVTNTGVGDGYKAELFDDPVSVIYPSQIDFEPIVVECVIPKGTVYYENDRGEIASESLKIVRTIEPEELCVGTENSCQNK